MFVFKKNRMVVVLPLAAALFALVVADVFVGTSFIPPSLVLESMFRPWQITVTPVHVIVRHIRLPIALGAAVVGASLGSSGAVMQTILRNPLASSYTLGIGAGASFGASMGIVLGFGTSGIALCAFGCSLAIAFAICVLGKKATPHTLTLTGIAFLFFFQGLQAFVQYLSSEEQSQQIVFWSFGSLQRIDYAKLLAMALSLAVSFLFFILHSWQYNALLLGDERAESMGVPTGRLRKLSFFFISCVAASSVCFTGLIGFVGIAAAHISRRMVGDNHVRLLPVSALVGAIMLSVADIISKFVSGGAVFPIGIITSLIGVPFFVAVLIGGR